MTLTFKWIDRGFAASNPANPRYPSGIDLDVSKGAPRTCKVALPYPAQRCGMFLVKCETCGQNAVVTTAGRTDDPRSVTVACRVNGKKAN